MRTIRRFVINALVMTATSLLMSAVAVWFNLYISRKIGMEAMGLFQLIMSVYSLAITLATSGVNLTATRLVAEELGCHSPAGIVDATRKCLFYSVAFGTAAGILLYGNASWIGLKWLGDAQTVRPIRVMAFSLPFLAMSSALSGYFTAVRRVVKNASVQIFEQFIKIVLTIAGLSLFAKNGLEQICLTMIGAGVVAEWGSFLGSYLLYRLDSRRYRLHQQPEPGMTRRLLAIGVPIALSSYLRSGLMTVKNLLVPVQLRKNGLSSEKSLATFGAIHGVVLPVVMFPSVFLSAFCSLIVPELTECQASSSCDIRTNKRIHYMVGRMFQAALLFSIGVSGLLFCFSGQVGQAASTQAEVGVYLKLFAPLIPIMYTDNAVDNMLKGLNEQVSSMRYNILDSFISAVLVYTLLPTWGIRGYLFILFLSEILNGALSLNRLIHVTQVHFCVVDWVVKPVICIAAACAATMAMGAVLPLHTAVPAIDAAVSIVPAILIYLLLLRITRCLTHEDVVWAAGVLKR